MLQILRLQLGETNMTAIECKVCNEITTHLIIWKGDVQYWQCQKCNCSNIPVLIYGEIST